MRYLLAFLLFTAAASFKVQASVAEPDPRAEDQFDVMNWLTEQGLHDIKEETWNAYGQFTYISSWFTADYQHIENPAYNADRGPVNIYAIKGHFEF